jgi:hypothetical protein
MVYLSVSPLLLMPRSSSVAALIEAVPYSERLSCCCSLSKTMLPMLAGLG